MNSCYLATNNFLGQIDDDSRSNGMHNILLRILIDRKDVGLLCFPSSYGDNVAN